MVGAPAATSLRRVAIGVISVSGLVYGTVAQAGDWTITPSIGVTEEFTDNSGLNSDNEDRNSDFTTTITPGLSIRGEGGRMSLSLDYNLDQTYYHRGTQPDEWNNELAATGQIEVWERIAFIDAGARISQELEDSTRVTSNSNAGQNINRTETRGFNVSPYFLHHLGQWAETETRLDMDMVTTESDTVEDEYSRTASVRINSGRRFPLFPWSIVALDRKTMSDGGEPSDTERRVDGSLSYVLNTKLTLTGTLGWEDVEDSELDSNPSGLTWSAGFTYRPSPRTSIDFSGGLRDDNTNFSLDASHSLSSRTTISASYSDEITTSQRLFAQQVAGFTTDPSVPGAVPFVVGGLQAIDTTTNDPIFIFPSAEFGLNDSTFRQRVARVTISGSRRRNTFSGSAFWEQRDTDSTGITETQYGGDFRISRRITPRLDGTVSLGATFTDEGTADNREEIDYDGSLSLSYQVRNDIRATLTYNLTLTKVNNAPDDVLENAVSLGLSKSF